MEKDDPSGAGARTDQSRTAGEESAPDGWLDALLAVLTAASFDVERQGGPGSLRATCAFHRRDEAYVLHRKATLWAAETTASRRSDLKTKSMSHRMEAAVAASIF